MGPDLTELLCISSFRERPWRRPSRLRFGPLPPTRPKGGVRVTDDVDRDFYRLAVQQAQSAHAIKAVHPLFFEWTENALEQLTNDERVGGSSGPKRKRLRRSSKWIEMACFIEGNHLKAIGHCFSTSTFIFGSVPLGHRMFQLYFRSATSVS